MIKDTYSWSSSDEHLDKRGYSVHSNNLLLGAACLLSGNCFSKVSRMLEFMGVNFFRKYVLQVNDCTVYSVRAHLDFT